MAKLVDRWETFGRGQINTFSLAGYLQSIPVHALLEKAVARGDLSREGMQTAYAGLGEVELEGLADNYVYGTPENRVPSAGVRIFHFDEENPPNLLTEVAFVESPLIEQFPLE